MVEDTHDGELLRRRRRPAAATSSPNGGPVGIGLFNYALSEQSIARPRAGRRGDQARSSSAAASAGS